MKKIVLVLFLVSSAIFSISASAVEGIAVVDLRSIFYESDLAIERFEELRDSSEFKIVSDEIEKKSQERISIAEELQKEGKTMSDEEKANIETKFQILSQDLQYAIQKVQALEADLRQKLEAEQTSNVQRVMNELIVAKKIDLLFNRTALLAMDPSNETINLTPEVINLLNQANKEK
tara:strand:- start:524 stop:1054 length:531 start_codon:yes stop_codon:yes gene_type:complete